MSKNSNIISILAEHFKCSESEFNNETVANDIPGWDSLTHAELLIKLETEFSIEFSLGDLMKMNNVGELIDLIESKQ